MRRQSAGIARSGTGTGMWAPCSATSRSARRRPRRSQRLHATSIIGSRPATSPSRITPAPVPMADWSVPLRFIPLHPLAYRHPEHRGDVGTGDQRRLDGAALDGRDVWWPVGWAARREGNRTKQDRWSAHCRRCGPFAAPVAQGRTPCPSNCLPCDDDARWKPAARREV